MSMNESAMLMIGVSVLAGLLSSMNVWVVNTKDIRLHLNDLYMALLMAGWMLLFSQLLSGHHTDDLYKWTTIAVMMIAISFYAIRNQVAIDDKQFLNGMIPHHSMAILMSEKIRDKTTNPEIKKLADSIIQSQSLEIQMMDNLINKLY